MAQTDHVRFPPDKTELPPAPASVSEPRGAHRKRCAQCGGSFGMIRRRRAGKQFCSVQCVERYVDGVRKAVEARARWYEFLYQRR